MSGELVNMTTFQFGEIQEIRFALSFMEELDKLQDTTIRIIRCNVKNAMFCVDFKIKNGDECFCYIELKTRQDIKPSYPTLPISHAKMQNIRDTIQIGKNKPTYLVWFDLKRSILYYTLYHEKFCDYSPFHDAKRNSYYIQIHMNLITKSNMSEFVHHIVSQASQSSSHTS